MNNLELAVEFGFKACERGENLQLAIANFRRLGYDGRSDKEKAMANILKDIREHSNLSHATATLIDSVLNGCPGHVASDDDPKVCRHCGTHVDEERLD